MPVAGLYQKVWRRHPAGQDETAWIPLTHGFEDLHLNFLFQACEIGGFLFPEDLDAVGVKVMELARQNQPEFLDVGILDFPIQPLFPGQ